MTSFIAGCTSVKLCVVCVVLPSIYVWRLISESAQSSSLICLCTCVLHCHIFLRLYITHYVPKGCTLRPVFDLIKPFPSLCLHICTRILWNAGLKPTEGPPRCSPLCSPVCATGQLSCIFCINCTCLVCLQSFSHFFSALSLTLHLPHIRCIFKSESHP